MKLVVIFAILFGFFHGSFGLRCHSCEGIACSRTTVSRTEECADNLSLCMTVNTKNYGVYAKGCDETLSEGTKDMCKEKDVECLACNTDLCNSVGSSTFKCIQCDSRTDQRCTTNANIIEPTQCPIPSASHSFCYAKQHQNGTVERGCSLTTKSQNDCFYTTNCRICSPDDLPGCNNMIFDSTGTGTPAPPATVSPPTPPITVPPPTLPGTIPTTIQPTTRPATNPPATTTLPVTTATTPKPGSATCARLSIGAVVLLIAHVAFN